MATENVGYLATFGGGVVSFLSPCMLPIVPASRVVRGGAKAALSRSAERYFAFVGWSPPGS